LHRTGTSQVWRQLGWQVAKVALSFAKIKRPPTRHCNDSIVTLSCCRFHIDKQHSRVSRRPSTLDPRPSTLDPRPSTLDPRPATLDPRPSTLSMKWVPRERPKIDRVASLWLIARFIDRDPAFLFVPPGEVLRVSQATGAIPYDIEGVELTHDGPLCSFD